MGYRQPLARIMKYEITEDAPHGVWLPINTAPMNGYMLIFETGAMRALLRSDGEWDHVPYPLIVGKRAWTGDEFRIVGDDARAMLPPGYRLGLGEFCDWKNPTHWMRLPEPPADYREDADEDEASRGTQTGDAS